MAIKDWFTFKSSEQIDAEKLKYKNWAYPYGDMQKEKIDNLIHELIPEEDPKFAVFNYLVCRQTFYPLDFNEIPSISTDDFIAAHNTIKKKFNPLSKKIVYKYMALVEADLKVNEELNYPSIDELRNRAQEIKNLLG